MRAQPLRASCGQETQEELCRAARHYYFSLISILYSLSHLLTKQNRVVTILIQVIKHQSEQQQQDKLTMAPPQVEQAIEKVDEFIAAYPGLTQYGTCFPLFFAVVLLCCFTGNDAP